MTSSRSSSGVVTGMKIAPPFASSFLTLAMSVDGSTGLGWNSSTGTISSSLSMLRPMAALTLVSMMMGSL